MNATEIISNVIDMMIKEFNLNLNTNEIIELKEKALYEYCMKNNVCYFRGNIK